MTKNEPIYHAWNVTRWKGSVKPRPFIGLQILDGIKKNKNKTIYHARNVTRWKGSVKPRPFIGLLILDVINRFIFGHVVVIYYKLLLNIHVLTKW